jgi:hypothetical protein
MATRIEKLMEVLDFHGIHTGGGCTAYERTFYNGSYMLVTDSDASIPTSWDDCWIGAYDSEGYPKEENGHMVYQQVKNLEELAEFVFDNADNDWSVE